MKDDVEQIVEIRDPEIDAESVMRRIRENIRKHRAKAEEEGVNYEAFVEGLYASKVTARFGHSLYYDLRRMSVGYDKINVGLSLTESRVPLVAPLVQRVRKALHHLVIYYTNKLAGKQARFNEYAVRALTGLVKELEEAPTSEEIESLQQDVQELKARIGELEARLESELE